MTHDLVRGPRARTAPAAARGASFARHHSPFADATERVLALAAHPVSRHANEAGESPLGDLVADAFRAAMRTEIAFVNDGSIRGDLDAGSVTETRIHQVLPHGDRLVSMLLPGRHIYAILEQQWADPTLPGRIHASGLSYTWDPAGRPLERIIQVRRDGRGIEREELYSVVTNAFLALGGDGLPAFVLGRRRALGPTAVDAVRRHLLALTQPFSVAPDQRIQVLY